MIIRPVQPPIVVPEPRLTLPGDFAWDAAPAGGSLVPAPTWELDSRDAVGAPTMTSWPLRRTGGTLTSLTPLSGQEPQVGVGIVRNGIPGVLFPTTAARASGGTSASLYSGSSDKWTIGIVCAPDEAFTNDPNCGHLFSIENASANSYDHGIVNVTSVPLGGGASTQHNVGAQWPSGPTTQLARAVSGAPASRNPQVIVYTYDSGVLTVERDGVTLGTRTDASRALAWVDAYIGAAGGAGPITQSSNHYPWKGTLWRVCGWVGGILTPAQRARWMAERAAEYAISAPAWTPANIASCTGWWDSRNKYDLSGPWLGGATMDEYSNQMDSDLQSRSWTNLGATSRPSDGPRSRGYAMLRFDGSDDFMQCRAATASLMIGAGALAVYARLIPRGINAGANKAPDSGQVYANAFCIGDRNGFGGLMFRDGGGGLVYPQAFAYTAQGGASEKAVQSFVPMTIGTEYTVSWRSDGTTMRVGVDGTETAYGGTVGAITDLSNPLKIGRNGAAGIAGQFDVRELVVCNADLGATDRSNLLAWMAAA